ncbi:RNA 2',3'-cyclic phosphodiesterase [Pseudomonas sp. 3A(2025)]
MNTNDFVSTEPLKRLFFALPCESAQRKAISRWRTDLRLRSGRPVPAENFHLTLMFLGAVGVKQIPAILETAARQRPLTSRLTVELDHLDVWRRSQALVLTAQYAPPTLLRWVYDLQQAMLPLGLELDAQEFRPHVTLMRDYRDPVPEAMAEPEFLWSAREFVLYESYKGRYQALGQWPLVQIPALSERAPPLRHPF